MPRSDSLIIIPAYNEEQNVGRVLKEVRSINPDVDIIVVNDGSKDKTISVVREAGEKVITLPYNLGYGGALQTGFKYAMDQGYSYIVQFDADGQHDPGEIAAILEHLKNGGSDIIIGSRFLGKGSMTISIWKKMAISLFRFLIKASTRVRITDPTSGLQGLRLPVFSYYARMGNYPEDFPDADTLICAILAGYSVKEIPANIKNRNSGKSMHYGFKTIFYIVKLLMSIIVVLIRNLSKAEGV